MWIQVKFKNQNPHRLYHYVCLSHVYEYDQVWLNPLRVMTIFTLYAFYKLDTIMTTGF